MLFELNSERHEPDVLTRVREVMDRFEQF
jgi:hypothetical protein